MNGNGPGDDDDEDLLDENDEEDLLDEEAEPLISKAELDEIEQAALTAKETQNIRFLAAPDLVLRLVRSHRRTSDSSLNNHLRWSESADVSQDLAENVLELRKLLRSLLEVEETNDARTLKRIRAVVQKALRAEERGDQSMKAEFGYAVDDVARYELPDDHYQKQRLPELGEVWEDGLGGRYRVVEADEENDAVRVEVLRPVSGLIEAHDLLEHARRVEETGEEGSA